MVEHMSLADVAAGRVPAGIAELARDPDARVRR
jgi:hypothetical protein